jgi:hypothetical protein
VEIESSPAGSAVCSSPVYEQSLYPCALDLRDRPETGRPSGPSASAVRPRVAAVSRPDREACCRTLELWNRNLDVESRGRLSAPSLESGSLESAYGGHPGIRVLGFWIVDLRIVPSPPPDRGAPKDLRSF